MKHGSLRRVLAAASATAMAGAALVIGGAGVASAESAAASYSVGGNWVTSSFDITRTVSDGAPTFGDVVEVRTEVQRTSLAHLLYRVRDFTPECFEYVPGTARWQATGGDVASEATAPGEFSRAADYVQFANGWGVTATPFWMTAEYTVTCDSGTVGSGGTWIKRAPSGNDELGSSNFGPSIDVKRLGTSVFLHDLAGAEIGKAVSLRVIPVNVPDGDEVAFSINGQHVGNAVVANGEATHEWIPTTAGSADVQASFAQTATHGGSMSSVRTIDVSEANVDSTLTVAAEGTPKVGESTRITATVDPVGAGGVVRFSYNGTEFDSAPVGDDGTASIDWYPSEPGQHTIDAYFTGRSGVNPSSKGLAVTVTDKDPDDIATSTELAPLPSTTVGEEVVLNATVSTGEAGGTVSFFDGAELIGSAPVEADGTATLSWSPDTEGERTIRAVFSGHENYLASQSTTQVTITPAIVEPEPDPDPTPPTEPDTGSLGSLTGSGDAGNASGSLGSLSNFGS